MRRKLEKGNMKRFISIFLVIFLTGLSLTTFGGQFYGGKGYLHTNSALMLPPGALDMSLYARGYTTQVGFETEGWNYLSNGTSALAASFGFNRSMELGFSQILYQDLNCTRRDEPETSVLIPGDTYIRFKIGGWPIGRSLFMSVMPAIRYRVGRFHDIHLEPYESKAVEGELVGMWSYFWKPLYPDEDKSLHFNLGYLNHNDAESISGSSQELTYLVCFSYPTRVLDYGVELYGASFVKKPQEDVLGRENWAYATPFVRYKPFKGFQFTMGVDALLIGYINTTVIEGSQALDKFPNYSKWRITGRISIAPSTAFYISPTFVGSEETGSGGERRSMRAEGGGRPGEAFDRSALFRWAIEEQVGGVDAVNLDLDKLKQERMKAEEELKKLKRTLEEKKRKGK